MTDPTNTRYFVDLDGHAEPTIWIGAGPDDPNCQPIVRKCTLDGEHPVLWPTVVQALTGAGDSTADETAEWEAVVQSIGSRVAALFTPDFRNDICEPMAFQNIMEAVEDGIEEYARPTSSVRDTAETADGAA